MCPFLNDTSSIANFDGSIERDNDPAYWLEQIKIHGGNSPVLFLINEQDKHKADIAKNTLKKEYPSIAGYYHVNIGSADTSALENFRQTVMNLVRDNISWSSQIISKEAYKIKADLRKLFAEREIPHITRAEFDKIAEKNDVTSERAEEILKDLHVLGICLWYDEDAKKKKDEMGKFKTLILNPNWITTGIYRLIDKGYHEQPREITIDYGMEKLKEIPHYEYTYEAVQDLFRLMRIYELAYFKSSNTNHIVIPGLLPNDMPDNLPPFPEEDCLTMKFEVTKALPPNVVCRVIVQRKDDILDDELLWRKGVVLEPATPRH